MTDTILPPTDLDDEARSTELIGKLATVLGASGVSNRDALAVLGCIVQTIIGLADADIRMSLVEDFSAILAKAVLGDLEKERLKRVARRANKREH